MFLVHSILGGSRAMHVLDGGGFSQVAYERYAQTSKRLAEKCVATNHYCGYIHPVPQQVARDTCTLPFSEDRRSR
jgi:hypothetical protein